MDNENSVGYHFRQILRISFSEMKERKLAFQCIGAVLYHMLFVILAFVFMRSDSETLFKLGLIIAPVYIIASFALNFSRYIPWQVFLIFTAGAAVEFILNVTHIIPADAGIVLGGFDQSLWAAYIVLQVFVLFIFTLIPYIVYNHKAKVTVTR